MTVTHLPVMIASPDGKGIATTFGCTCGEAPKTGAAKGSTMQNWMKAHARKVGAELPVGAFSAASDAWFDARN